MLDNEYQAVCLTNVTHGGSTKISSYVERLRGISKSEISSFRLILWQTHL